MSRLPNERLFVSVAPPTFMSNQAFTEAKGVLTLTPSAYNVGTSDQATPDGTLARRLQVSARFSW